MTRVRPGTKAKKARQERATARQITKEGIERAKQIAEKAAANVKNK